MTNYWIEAFFSVLLFFLCISGLCYNPRIQKLCDMETFDHHNKIGYLIRNLNYTLRTCAGPPLNIQCHLLNLPPYYQTRAKLGAALQTAMSFSDSVTFFLPSPYSATKPNFFGMVHPVIKWSIQYSYLITRLMHALCLFLQSN